ncbi:SDR family NAD(P)-dependent oxidoreductase [Parafrankia sp. BMG5.11]|uniref:SDR family NAD(P)-dependent oxidoreductase n=1 Tax=Parafrankia sp. BMG5.11 TaxID=222540 RepID=UPI00103EEF0B|nr:SDR family NAD(P)-dependent oxidoreductase [Parafrankia sp. BMG5.11]TCJ37070.1 SDR family NAD(P)-dependent oxidoreductase [Parafrankia sp. BMG5.11]
MSNENAELTVAEAAEVAALFGAAGKIAIVAGASSGVGVSIARALAGAGAAVTLAVRDCEAGRRVAAEIADATGAAAPAVEHIDLLSLASVRAFAARWGDRPLDLLINNAGLMGPPRTITIDGFESQMAVNFFAPLLLSELLVPNLAAAAPSRVVMVSSGSHHSAELRLDDLNYDSRDYDKFEAYGHAKLCANLLAVEFSIQHAGEGIVMNAATPGGVMTNLGRHVTFADAVALGWINEDGTLPQGAMKTPDQGAASPLWAALAPAAAEGGVYVEDCAIAPIWAPPTPPGWAVTRQSLDPQAASGLWSAAWPLVESAGLEQ